MAALTANNGRIVFSLAVAIKARLSFQRASLRCGALRAWSHGSSSGAIATIVLPQLRFCRLGCTHQAQRLIQPSKHKSSRTISARRGGVNWKMDKLTRGQAVERPTIRRGKFPVSGRSTGSVKADNRLGYIVSRPIRGKTQARTGMTSGSSPSWQWIIVILLALCVVGYIWTLQ